MNGTAMKVCVAVLLVTACTHHHPVTTLLPVSPSDEATADLANGRSVNVRAAPTPAGTRWVARDEAPAGASVIVESTDMRSYTTVSHGRGFAEGLGLGALAGTVLGVVIGAASGDDKCPPENFCLIELSAGAKAALGGIVLGGLGVLVGGLLGAVVGSRDVYALDSAYVPHVSAMIAPGRAGGGLSWSF